MIEGTSLIGRPDRALSPKYQKFLEFHTPPWRHLSDVITQDFDRSWHPKKNINQINWSIFIYMIYTSIIQYIIFYNFQVLYIQNLYKIFIKIYYKEKYTL